MIQKHEIEKEIIRKEAEKESWRMTVTRGGMIKKNIKLKISHESYLSNPTR